MRANACGRAHHLLKRIRAAVSVLSCGMSYSDIKVTNRNVRDFGWEIAHAAVSRRPPILLSKIVARTRMYTHAAKVCMGFVHRSRAVFCRPAPNPTITIRNFCTAVRRSDSPRLGPLARPRPSGRCETGQGDPPHLLALLAALVPLAHSWLHLGLLLGRRRERGRT
jgi:hypothetical protein